MSSRFQTREICQLAFEDVEVTFLAAAEAGRVKRRHGALVFVNPTEKYRPLGDRKLEYQDFIHRSVLFVGFIGNPKDFDYPYHKIALGKAFISWITGLPSLLVQKNFARLLEDGDTVFGGSDVADDGTIVAFSGVDSEDDVSFAAMGNERARSMSQKLANAFKADPANEEISFYGGEPFPAPEGYDLDRFTGHYDEGSVRCPFCDWRHIHPEDRPKDGIETYYECSNPNCRFTGKYHEFKPPKFDIAV